MVARLFKEENGFYLMRFYFNTDIALKTPIYEVEVLPRNEEDTWVFELVASADNHERKECQKNG